MFQKQKESFLKKTDKSKKGSIDLPIKKLINIINKRSEFYTTSSCSGRTVLIAPKKKKGTEWFYITHKKASLKDIENKLKNIPKKDIWIKFEPFIIHIACKNFDSAEQILKKARNAGIKKAGIQSTKKILVEMIGTDSLNALIAKKGKIMITKDYLKELIRQANLKQKNNLKKIKKLETHLKRL